MSRIKYPDKQKIRNQIDIILDKSELFNDSKDKTIHTSDKIVELKPVRQGIPVKKIVPVEMYYNNTRLYSAEERIYKAISNSLESYIALGRTDIYVTATYTIDKDGMFTVLINQMPYDKLELDLNTK